MTPDTLLLFLGGPEMLLLIVFPLLYVLPVWLSFRTYGPGQSHWRLMSIVFSLLLSWIGFILVRSIRSGMAGYLDGRAGRDTVGQGK